MPADAVLVAKRRSADRRIAADGRVGAGAQDGERRCRRRRNGAGRAATTCRMSFPARWSCAARASPKSSPPAPAARSARSASRSARWRPSRRGCRRRPAGWCGSSPWSAARSASWRCCSTALLRGGWLDAVLAGIALGMSMLPEEFPVVLTVFMAMGAWRISRARVLTRRAAAIETLGSATVLCTDKTGTLTENRMSIAELRLKDGEVFPAREATRREHARGVSRPGRVRRARQRARSLRSDGEGVPRSRSRAVGRDRTSAWAGWTLVHAYGLRPDLLAMSQVWQPADGRQEFVIAAKGAPEAIADLCHLDAAELAALTQVRGCHGRRGAARAGRRPRLLRGDSHGRSRSTISRSSSWVSSASPIRCARACPRP